MENNKYNLDLKSLEEVFGEDAEEVRQQVEEGLEVFEREVINATPEISYPYDDLIDEIISDIREHLLDLNGRMEILRGKPIYGGDSYRPIIDYCYEGIPESMNWNKDGKFETVDVFTVLEEMERLNKII